MRKLFILGCGRSGTTMLQQALNRHPRIVIPPETDYFIDVVGRLAWRQRRRLRQIEEDLGLKLQLPRRQIRTCDQALSVYEQIADAYLKRLGREDADYFGEKSPRHLLVAPRVLAFFPDAKFIVIHRDGRDVALSLTCAPWTPNDLYLNFARWLRFCRCHRWIAAQSDVDLLCVRYEDFVIDPETHLRRVASFLELEYEPAMGRGSGNQTGVLGWEHWKQRALKPIDASRVGVWRRELTPRQVAILERCGGDVLRWLGYELQTGGDVPSPALFRTWHRVKQGVWFGRCAVNFVGREVNALFARRERR